MFHYLSISCLSQYVYHTWMLSCRYSQVSHTEAVATTFERCICIVNYLPSLSLDETSIDIVEIINLFLALRKAYLPCQV